MKNKNKIRLTTPVTPALTIAVTTRHDAERVTGEIALATANKIKTVAAMDAEILALKEKYGPQLAVYDADLTARTEALQVWASAHPEEFPKGLKSITFVGGRIGFRTATPSLVPLNRKWTWEKITRQVCSILPNFIRNAPEVDREAILAQRDEEAIKAVLPTCGLKVHQGESFYVEPDLTALQVRQSQPADKQDAA